MDLQVPLEQLFEKPAWRHQLKLWSTAIHLLKLVYKLNWKTGRNVKKELAGGDFSPKVPPLMPDILTR
jgi:hypothetical protein